MRILVAAMAASAFAASAPAPAAGAPTTLCSPGEATLTKGVVPDASTAVRIAEAVLAPIYGTKEIEREKPFTARLQGDVWVVDGSLPRGVTHGGVATAHISKLDGRVLFICHGK